MVIPLLTSFIGITSFTGFTIFTSFTRFISFTKFAVFMSSRRFIRNEPEEKIIGVCTSHRDPCGSLN